MSSQRLVQNLRADGHHVDVMNLAPPATATGSLKGIVNKARLAWATLGVPFKVCLRKRYDIIHLHVSGYPRRVYFRLMQPLLRPAKIINTVHGDVTYYTNRHLSTWTLGAGDGIICVRPGDDKLLPSALQPKAVQIPAFIMPPNPNDFPLPQNVGQMLNKAHSLAFPLIVFNGALVTDPAQYDLYGFNIMAQTFNLLREQGIRFLALVMVNDSQLTPQKSQLLEPMRQAIKALGNDALLEINSGFSLLPIMANEWSIYVRPTSTDGDSLSVREALALGMPVLASNVCPRPQGTISFGLHAGAPGLAQQIANTIMALPHNCAPLGHAGFYTDIKNFYEKIIAPNKADNPQQL